jgi:hypothetical protein
MNSFQEPNGPESEVFPNGEMFPDCKLGKNAIMQNYWFIRQWFLLASELHRAKFTLFEPSSASPSSQKELFGTGYTMQSRTAMFFYRMPRTPYPGAVPRRPLRTARANCRACPWPGEVARG